MKWLWVATNFTVHFLIALVPRIRLGRISFSSNKSWVLENQFPKQTESGNLWEDIVKRIS